MTGIVMAVWLYLITHVACDVIITVSNNGSDNDKCCVNGTCPCSSLSSALCNVSDNTVINITSESVTLHDIIGMGSGNLNDITITGNVVTIMCNNTGGVYCESCSDITIIGITWYQCGHTDPENQIKQTPALKFINVSNIYILDCKFENSSGCPVYMQNAKGEVSFTNSSFIANRFDVGFVYGVNYSFCAGLYISFNAQIILAINDSRFDDNGCGVKTSIFCIDSYFSAQIVSNNVVSEYSQFVFKNTNFSYNSNGLSLKAGGEILLFNVNAYNNANFGIYIVMGENTGKYSSYISMSSATFMNNADAFILHAGSHDLNIDIDNSTFSNTPNGMSQLGIDIHFSAALTHVTMSNLLFYNNQNGAVSIQTSNENECITAYIRLTNVTVYGTTIRDPLTAFESASVYIFTVNTLGSIVFNKVNFTSNHFLRHKGGVLVVKSQFTACNPDNNLVVRSVSIKLTDCTIFNNTAFDDVAALSVLTSENQGSGVNHEFNINIELSDCNFDFNFGGNSVVHIDIPLYKDLQQVNVVMLLDNSVFSDNKGTALILHIPQFHLRGTVQFINNSATTGAAVYVKEVHDISTDNWTNVQFINNTVKQKGGAMYINLVINYCDVFQDISNPSHLFFINNSADIAGNSIFFSIPQTCKIITNTSSASSLLYIPNKFNYSQPFYVNSQPVVTSPYKVELYPPAIAMHSSTNDYLIQEPKMLGQLIWFTASVLDYFGHVTEPVIFSIECITCGNDYVLSTHLVTLHDHSLSELAIFTTEPTDVVSSTNISMKFLSVLSPIYKSINFSLSIKLSSCSPGYLFDKSQRKCSCFPYSDIVHCTGQNSAEIKFGYWIGFITVQYYAASVCPKEYCNFAKRTETSQGYYNIPKNSDNQCNSNRTGFTCGECKSGYTLAYDSPDCINTDNCSVGMTILVIMLTVLYWIAVVSGVFCLMYFRFKIPLGYVYAIIYYYSIVDVVLINDVSEGTSWLVTILSSFAKLTPQLFGQLCLIEGLRGIDQLFINYSHALAVSLIVLIIVLAARRSGRLTRFVGPCIIRVICLLLLLAYTSLASISLQLLRPLPLSYSNYVGKLRTYSSPDIEYFTGRHLVYAIVAILCEVIIVIGLPLFLLLEPCLSRLNQKINFVRIKPLLDEFQDSYKGKYRWFASYYLICRQVILLIVYAMNGDYHTMLYFLQTACIIITIVHICFQPYKSCLLNALDGVILLILVLVVNLNTFSFSFLSSISSTVLVLLPLLLLICLVTIRKLFDRCCNRQKRVVRLFNPIGENDRNENYDNQRRFSVNVKHDEFQDSLLDYSDNYSHS